MSNNISNYQKYTFPKLLEQYDKILVPMIQRDYAQGRTDKKETDVRNNLLTDIFSDNAVNFDLVFGSVEKRIVDGVEKNCFIPVDGQQRLTTLFLLYLYGKKTKKLDTELDLSKFSYDTRRAASDFCINITSKDWSLSNGKKVSDVIKDSSWFMNYWEQDPTVEGMLNMLDAIHEKCKEITDYPNLSKVTFFFFDLESNGLNENLYLKMNSRGKPLTAFENLKAKMEKILPEDVEFEDKCFPKCDASPKDNFKAKWKYFMDRNWTEAFWDKDNPSKYDVNIAKFIVRFLAGYWAAFSPEENLVIADKLKNLNRKEQDDKNYADFIPFESIKEVLEVKNAFSILAYALTSIPTITSYWANDTIKVSNKSEYKFLAVVFTFVLFDGDKDAMRFAWNMAENYVTEYDTFVTYCKRVGEIYKFKCNNNSITFYNALSSVQFAGNTSEQMKEEISKANQIVNGGSEWKSKIIEAEQYAFFKGAIRFLFSKEEIGDDWEDFDTKWGNAQKYFDANGNGVQDGEEPNKKYRTNSLLMKSLLANGDWGNIWWRFEFSNDSTRWRRILLADHWKKAVDMIMSREISEDVIISDVKESIKNIIDDGLMDYVCNERPGAWIRDTYDIHPAMWQSGYPSSRILLTPILAELKHDCHIEYSEDNSIEKCRYCRCKADTVNFKYNGKYFFQWHCPNRDNLYVYLMEDEWKEKKHIDDNEYYFFKVDANTTTDSFTQMLDCLIKQAYPNESDKTYCKNCQNKICN